MQRKIELLAPGGSIDCIKAAIIAGANAIYCGLDKFNARNRAENIVFEDLQGILRLAHSHDCEVFLTLNIIIVESEIPALIALLNKLVNTRIDGVIVQDLGMLYLLRTYFPNLTIHASTQLTTHNKGQIQFLSRLSVARVNLSRELSLPEIQALTVIGHEHQVLTEVFVHGSQCLSFSGICYMSSVLGGNSGNRGRCSQPCRDQYLTTAEGNDFPLNLKDNSAYFDVPALADAGVDSIKIEGRIKKFHYVYTVVQAFKKQLQRLDKQEPLHRDTSDLYTVFNRDFTNGFLQGDINKEMFIDNPRDHSALHRAGLKGGLSDENLEQAKRELYDLKTEIITTVRSKIAPLSIAQAPLTLTLSGQAGTPLQVAVQTPDRSFALFSESNLVDACGSKAGESLVSAKKKNSVQGLDAEMLLQRFKAVNDTEYFMEHVDGEHLQPDLFLPFKELTALKKRLLFVLHGSKDMIEPIAVPRLPMADKATIKPTLSLLISSEKDVHLGNKTAADIYYQLPNSFKAARAELRALFEKNNIIPWFPSVLIGEDYSAAVEFLQELQPKQIVTNNTGIAYEAYQQGIPWIAGPALNTVNSFSLICLKEYFNCHGAFISNEINQQQIKRIKRPADFKLYYSLYHPITLLTSRQCLFHQVTGCTKNKMDGACVQHCEKSAGIINLKKVSLLLKKTKGNYHKIYNEINYLNTDIVMDVPDVFASFFIDLRDIETATTVDVDKSSLVQLFAHHVAGKPDSPEELKQHISPTTSSQYEKGI